MTNYSKTPITILTNPSHQLQQVHFIPSNLSIYNNESSVPDNLEINGTSSTMSVNTMSWLQTPTSSPKAKGRKTKEPRIAHKIFMECAKWTNDPYWKETFHRAATNKFPRGFKYEPNSSPPKLSYRIKNKRHEVEIPDDPVSATNIFINFLRTEEGIQSSIDEEEEKQHRNVVLEQKHETWKDIRKKTVKADLISQYIQYLKLIYKLSIEEEKDLQTLINVGFLMHCFSNDNIDYIDGHVRKIIGLEFNENTRKFTISNKYLTKMKLTKSKPVVPDEIYFSQKRQIDALPIVPMMDHWHKFTDRYILTDVPTEIKFVAHHRSGSDTFTSNGETEDGQPSEESYLTDSTQINY